MSNDDAHGGGDKLLKKDILEKAKELLNSLESGNVTKSRCLIGALNDVREDSLYYELGKLTRELHESLKDIDVGIATQEIPSARNRLGYVIKLTEEAANKTMDGIDATIPLSNDLAEEAKSLLDEWTKFKRRELSLQEFKKLYKEMMDFLESVEKTAVTIHDNLQEVLLAQNYQDLTGQAIKKVMDTVSGLEHRLVDLVKIASEANSSFGADDIATEEGSDSDSDDSGDSGEDTNKEVKGQDEVDDLLSSLGF